MFVLKTALKILEQHFQTHKFFPCEDLTLADLHTVSQMAGGFQYVLDEAWRAENPNITRLYTTIANLPIWKAISEETIFIDEAVPCTP